MTATTEIRAQVDETLNNEAAAILAEMGLSVSDVLRIALTRIARDKALPFEMHVPNALTAQTLAQSERGEAVFRAKNAQDLFEQLGI